MGSVVGCRKQEFAGKRRNYSLARQTCLRPINVTEVDNCYSKAHTKTERSSDPGPVHREVLPRHDGGV